MSEPDIVGPLFSPHLLEEAAIRTLREWLPTYTTAVYNRYKVKLPEIAAWGLQDSTKRTPEQRLPSLIVIAGGIGQDGAPEEHQDDGMYRAGWAIGVAVAVESSNPIIARRNAQLYGAVVRGAILQHRNLGLEGCVTKWLDENYPHGSKDGHTRAVAESLFAVEIDEVVSWQMGPKDAPPKQLPADDPEITEVEVQTEVE